MEKSDAPRQDQPPNSGRREFLAKACTVALGGVAMAPPIACGIALALHPLRRGGANSGAFVRVTSLEALPSDGVPRKFAVLADRVDAWNKHAAVPVGAVYLRRTGETEITAFNTSCPHAGCFVDYMPARNHFWCPCHNSAFSLDGAIETPSSPAARPLDTLEVEIRNQTEVWVKFQNFRMGTAEKIPV